MHKRFFYENEFFGIAPLRTGLFMFAEEGGGSDSGGGEEGSDDSGDGGEGAGDSHWSEGLAVSFGDIDTETDEGKAAQGMLDKFKGVEAKDLAGMLKGEVPEAYAAPEIEGVEFNQELVSKFSEFAKEKGFTQEQYTSLLEFQADAMASAPDQIKAAQEAMFTEERNAMLETIGKEKYDALLVEGAAAIKVFADEDAQKWLEDNGLNGAPAIMRMFANVGKLIGEDTHHQSGGNGQLRTKDKRGSGDVNRAERMFGNK